MTLVNAVAILFVVLLGCEGLTAEIRVAVSSNFTTTFDKIIEEYKKNHDEKIIVSKGSTGRLYSQIVNGMPVDIFLSADNIRTSELEKAKIAVPGTRQTYAIGKLAFWSPRQLCSNLDNNQLSKHSKIAMANIKHAPYGIAAAQVLKHLNLETYTKSAVTGENISQTYEFISSGNVSGGFVAYSQLLQNHIPTNQYCLIPNNLHAPIEQQLVLIKNGNSDAAKPLYNFILNDPTAIERIQRDGYELSQR